MNQVEDEIKDTTQEMASRAKAAGIAAWEKTKAGYLVAQDKVVEGARVTDRSIRTHPYQALGIAFGVGLLLGFFIKKRS